MGQYVASRVAQLVLVLVGVSVVVFVTMHLLPGDVAQMLLGDHATAVQLVRLRRQLGLDQPIWVQYWRFLFGALRGDLGMSLQSNHPALQDVLTAFPVTLQLSLTSLAIATVIGVPLGVLTAVWKDSRFDGAMMTLTLFGVSMPIFWLGLMLLLVFAAWLGWVPVGGQMPVGDGAGADHRDDRRGQPDRRQSRDDLGQHPSFAAAGATLAAVPLALITRITRAEVTAAGTLDHVRTARAKGLSGARVVMRHVLRNAAIPIVTVIGLQMGLLLSGAVLTETIFSLPGLGRLMVDAILERDYPVVQAGALFTAALFVLVNLMVDLSYAVLDPRISRA